MRTLFLVTTAALALCACNKNGEADNNMAVDMNAVATDNMVIDQNAAMTGNMDANAAMTANGAADATTQEMMNKDLHTNDRDTNLANGM